MLGAPEDIPRHPSFQHLKKIDIGSAEAVARFQEWLSARESLWQPSSSQPAIENFTEDDVGVEMLHPVRAKAMVELFQDRVRGLACTVFKAATLSKEPEKRILARLKAIVPIAIPGKSTLFIPIQVPSPESPVASQDDKDIHALDHTKLKPGMAYFFERDKKVFIAAGVSFNSFVLPTGDPTRQR